MPVIEPGDQSLKNLKGLHLWHGDLSSCSQRVRITLAEKGLEWESHPISIPDNEHATPEYQAINPDGLVPAFVHDGVLMIESKDIIQYLDTAFPAPPLRPDGEEGQRQLQKWVDDADTEQSDLKLLSHEFLFRPRKKMTPEDVEAFAASHRNKELVEFIREWQSADLFSADRIAAAVDRTHAYFAELDGALSGGGPWIMGGQFTLAEAAWMPNVHRMWLMDWPLGRYPNLSAWFERARQRPSFVTGLADWEPDGVAERFRDYVSDRNARAGIHVRNFGALAV
jgi:glutathione S-transferase